VPLLPGHNKIESTVMDLGIEADDDHAIGNRAPAMMSVAPVSDATRKETARSIL
jgi:hypothetical protein